MIFIVRVPIPGAIATFNVIRLCPESLKVIVNVSYRLNLFKVIKKEYNCILDLTAL